MDVLSIATGVAGAGASYFLYRCARDGLPALLAWVKAKWAAGKGGAAAIADELDHAHDRIDALEKEFVRLAGDVAKLKNAGTAAAGAPAAAPSFLAPGGQ